MVQAIAKIAQHPFCADTVIIARGGGSREDLWVFNDETLVRAAASLPMPFVSAVGHETDFTLLDFAADMRAATPTAAAELAVPNAAAWVNHAALQAEEMQNSMHILLNDMQQQLDTAVANTADGAVRLVSDKQRQLDNADALLRSLSPLATLSRGYAIVSRDDKAVSSARLLSAGDRIALQFCDGSVDCTVNEVTEKQ